MSKLWLLARSVLFEVEGILEVLYFRVNILRVCVVESCGWEQVVSRGSISDGKLGNVARARPAAALFSS